MRILVISNDSLLISMIKSSDQNDEHQMMIDDTSNDPLDVLSSVCINSPKVLIVDDDFIRPNTVHILNSIKKIHKNLTLIFVTSDTGVELGSQVGQLGVQLYAIKPLEKDALIDSLSSIIKYTTKQTYS